MQHILSRRGLVVPSFGAGATRPSRRIPIIKAFSTGSSVADADRAAEAAAAAAAASGGGSEKQRQPARGRHAPAPAAPPPASSSPRPVHSSSSSGGGKSSGRRQQQQRREPQAVTFQAGGLNLACTPTAGGQLRVCEAAAAGDVEYVVVLPPRAAGALGRLLRGVDGAEPRPPRPQKLAAAEGGRAFELSLEPRAAQQHGSCVTPLRSTADGSNSDSNGNGSSSSTSAASQIEEPVVAVVRIRERGRGAVTLPLGPTAARRLRGLAGRLAAAARAADTSSTTTGSSGSSSSNGVTNTSNGSNGNDAASDGKERSIPMSESEEPAAASPLVADEEVVMAAAAAAASALPDDALAGALAALQQCHLGLPVEGLAAGLALLAEAAARRPESSGSGGAGGLPAEHVPLANGVCAALVSKRPAAGGDAKLRALAQAAVSLAELAARGGHLGSVATARAAQAALFSSSAALPSRAPVSAAGWLPPPAAAGWLVSSLAAAAAAASADAPPGDWRATLGPAACDALLPALADCAALAAPRGDAPALAAVDGARVLLLASLPDNGGGGAGEAAEALAQPQQLHALVLRAVGAASLAAGCADSGPGAAAAASSAQRLLLAAGTLDRSTRLCVIAALADAAAPPPNNSGGAIFDMLGAPLLEAVVAELDAAAAGARPGSAAAAAAADLSSDAHTARLLAAALSAAARHLGRRPLPRAKARRLLGAAWRAVAAAQGGGNDNTDELLFADAYFEHDIAPPPPLLPAALAQAARAPEGALTPRVALRLVLATRRQLGPGGRSSSSSSSSASVSDAAASVAARHLQARLRELPAAAVERLIAALISLNAAPPPGFAAAVEAAMEQRLVLLPQGRPLLNVLQALQGWGRRRPGAAFMRGVYEAAGALLDTFSAVGLLELLGACWEAAAPGSTARRGAAAPAPGTAAQPPLPPPTFVADALRALDGRPISPEAAAEGLRLLGALRLRPSPALLAQWLAPPGGAAGVATPTGGGADPTLLSPRLLLAALWGACELRVAPPSCWLDAALSALAPPGRMSACAPATLAGIALALHRLGVEPSPSFCSAAAAAAAAAVGSGGSGSTSTAWDARSLSVLLGALASWRALPPPGAAAALARGAAAAAAEASEARDGASAARLFLWWRALRASPDCEKLLQVSATKDGGAAGEGGGMAPEELFAIELAIWSAALRALPQPGEAWPRAVGGDDSGSSGLAPRAALVPMFIAAIEAAADASEGDGGGIGGIGSGAPPAFLDRAWRGGAAAAAAADDLSAGEAGALLVGTLARAPGAFPWDARVAQAVLRAGYRAREGQAGTIAAAEALEWLGFGSEALRALVETQPAYHASWEAGGDDGGGDDDAASMAAPGLPPACEAALAQAHAAALAAEQQGVSSSGEPRSVAAEVWELQAAVVEDVPYSWIEAGFD